jgi:hypothetical protein
MNENRNLDKVIDELKKVSANSSPPGEVVERTLEKLALMENEHIRTTRKVGWAGFLKMAAAAVFILAAGFYVGRLTKPIKLDAEQLGSLQKTLKSTLELEIKQNLQEKLEQDFQSLVRTNNVQLNDLAAAIDTAQKWERLLIAAALKQMESNRLNENNELRNELVTFASLTERKLAETEKSLAKLTGNNSPDKSPVNQTDNLK